MTSLALLLLLSSPPAPATPVTAVQVAAPAGHDEQRLRRYVTVSVGAPLDSEELRRSVRHLFATGQFSDVIVERRTRAGGIELVFRPVRAARLAAIVVEGDPLLSPAQLRRITRLRDGELLWPLRLEKAAQDAAVELAELGHLEARVTATTNRADPDGRAVFHIQAGPMTRIQGLRVTGLSEAKARQAAGQLASQPGQAFSRRRALHEGEQLRRRLRQAGYWSAAVDVRELYDPLRSRMDLVFDVRTGTRMTLEFRGLDPGRRAVRQARRLLAESGFREDALEEVVERLEDDLRRDGFAEANVSYEQEDQAGERRVVFVVAPGARVQVVALDLVGVSREGLLDRIATRVGQPFRQDQVERDAQALTRALEAEGFPEARVQVDAQRRAGSAAVVFRVALGGQRTVASVHVDTPFPVAGATAAELPLRAGDPYRAEDVARARNALAAAFQNAGYSQASVTAETNPDASGNAVAVDLHVEPGERVRIDHILVSGLQRTREEVVRRELLVREGEPLRWDRVLESHRRLSALGLFRGVSVYDLDPDESDSRTIVFTVEEGPRTTLTYGLGAAGVSAELNASARSSDVNPTLRASAEVTRRNLGGLDRDLSLFTRLSFRGSRFLAAYHEPYFGGRKAEMAVTVFREEEQRQFFNFERIGTSLQTTHQLTPRLSLILRYVFSRTRSSDLRIAPEEVDRQFRNARSSGPSFSLVADTRDDPLDPHRGRFLAADTQFSDAVLGGHSFFKSFVQAAAFQNVRGPLLVAVGARVGAAWTFRGQELDPPDRFYAGGHYSMRGFDTDAVAPSGGESLWVGSVELRCSLGKSLSLAAFGDVGNVYGTVASASLSDLRASTGIGLRYRTPVGPIRFDWGFKLNPRPGEPRSRPHITVGHAF